MAWTKVVESGEDWLVLFLKVGLTELFLKDWMWAERKRTEPSYLAQAAGGLKLLFVEKGKNVD